MEPLTWIFGGLTISVVSGAIGKVVGSKGNVKETLCNERQIAIKELVVIKIDNLSDRFEKLEKAVNGKLLSL